jgi:hypothetical protein
MQQADIYQSPSMWILGSVLIVYLFVLFRALFIFFFLGGRQLLLDAEKNISVNRKQRETVAGVVEKMCKGKRGGCERQPDERQVCAEHPHVAAETEKEEA